MTGVDICNKYFNIVKEYSSKERLTLILCEEKYDFIICDFVLSDNFLNNIYDKLKVKGMFLINTVNIDKNILITKLNRYF